MDRYPLHRALPARGTTCHGSEQPFRADLDATDPVDRPAGSFDLRTATAAEIAAHGLPVAGAAQVLPPVIG